MAQFGNWAVAEVAGLPFVPLSSNRPHQVTARVSFDLAEAGLIAVFTLRPTGAAAQFDVFFSYQGASSSATGGDFYRDCFVSFRTSDQHFAEEVAQGAAAKRYAKG